MRFRRALTWAACLLAWSSAVQAQPVRAVPRPPAQAPGPPRPEDGSAAPDGYAPTSGMAGTNARLTSGEDGRVRRRDRCRRIGRARSPSVFFPTAGSSSASVRAASGSSAKTGRSRSRSTACRPICWFAAGRVCSKSGPIGRSPRTGRSISTYTVLPDGSNPAALPRSPGVARRRAREALAGRQAARGREGAVERRRHRRPADPGARRDAVRHLDDSGRPRHQLRGLAAAAAARQQHGQGAADQRRRIDSEGQPVCRPRRRASGNLRARLPRHPGRRHPSANRQTLDERTRTARRRRDQRRSTRARTTASR